jgi:hypothetical protein
VIRRKTCIQETKNSIFVSRDKLLKYHEAMVKKFVLIDPIIRINLIHHHMNHLQHLLEDYK